MQTTLEFSSLMAQFSDEGFLRTSHASVNFGESIIMSYLLCVSYNIIVYLTVTTGRHRS